MQESMKSTTDAITPIHDVEGSRLVDSISRHPSVAGMAVASEVHTVPRDDEMSASGIDSTIRRHPSAQLRVEQIGSDPTVDVPNRPLRPSLQAARDARTPSVVRSQILHPPRVGQRTRHARERDVRD